MDDMTQNNNYSRSCRVSQRVILLNVKKCVFFFNNEKEYSIKLFLVSRIISVGSVRD